MPLPDIAVFDAADVIEIASRLTLDDGAFVVGGQATNLWAWFYADRHADLSSEKPFTSQDIDYYGTLEAAAALATALDGRVLKPSANDMNTPNTAVVEAEFKGKTLRVDFLHGVLGVSKRSLRTGITELQVSAELEGEEKAVRVAVMNPINCLKSRVGNMLSPATKRRDDLAFRQLHAAVAVVGVYIEDALSEGDAREATSSFRDLFQYLRSDTYGRNADQELDIDILDLLTRHVEDERIDVRYREYQLKKMVSQIEAARASRASRSTG